MQTTLPQSKPNGELPLVYQVVIVVLSLALATFCFLAARSYIPVSAGLGQLALAALFVAAVPGYVTILSSALNVFQGGRVRPGSKH